MEGLPIDTIIKGDSLEVLRGLPDGFAQLVLTSPPYWGLRDYRAGGESLAGQWGREPTPEAHVERLVEWAREVRRVLRDDGVLVLNYGESYASSSLSDHHRGKATPAFNGRGKRQHIVEGWENPPRMPPPPGLKPKDLVGMPWRIAQALQADGWWWRAWWPWVKLNGMPESTRDRPALSCEVMLMFSKRARYYWDQEAVRVGYDARVSKMPDNWDTGPGGHGSHHRNGREKGATNLSRSAVNRREFRGGGTYTGGRAGKGELIPNRTPGNEPAEGHGRIRKTGDWYRESVALAAAQTRAWADHAEAHLAGGAPMLLDFDGFPLGQLHPTYAYPGSHFATYPPALVRPIIRAATSERGQCPACGAPWVREVERNWAGDDWKAGKDGDESGRTGGRNKPKEWEPWSTTGWRASCSCDAGEPVPQIVLDPFAGTGTTCVVAAEEGRHTIGIDLYGGDHDFGGHTAMDRLRAASGEGAPLEHVRAEREEGQLSLLGERE